MSRPFSDEGKDWFMDFLRRHKFSNIIDTDSYDRYQHWDIEGEFKGEKVLFELKSRDFPSYKYGDVTIDYSKVQHLEESGCRGVIVYFWSDRWCMIDLKTHPYTIIRQMTRSNTRFGGARMIERPWAVWSLDKIRLLDYGD